MKKHVLFGYIKVGFVLCTIGIVVGSIERFLGIFGLSWWFLIWGWGRGLRLKWLVFCGMVMDFLLIRPIGVSIIIAAVLVLIMMLLRERHLHWFFWWLVCVMTAFVLRSFLAPMASLWQCVLLPGAVLVVLLWRERQTS